MLKEIKKAMPSKKICPSHLTTNKLDDVIFNRAKNYSIIGGYYGIFKFVVIGRNSVFSLEKA